MVTIFAQFVSAMTAYRLTPAMTNQLNNAWKKEKRSLHGMKPISSQLEGGAI